MQRKIQRYTGEQLPNTVSNFENINAMYDFSKENIN